MATPVDMVHASFPLVLMTCTLTVLLYFIFKMKHHRRSPPGPPTVPILGSIPFIYRHLHKPVYKMFTDMMQEYGEVFTVQFGNRNMVVINGFDNIHHALVSMSSDFAGRPPQEFRDRLRNNPNHYGIGRHTYTKELQAQRYVTTTLLKSLGYGKLTTERKILEECNALVASFTKYGRQAFDPHALLDLGVCNIMGHLLFGERFTLEDHRLMYLLDMLTTYISQSVGQPELDFIPLTRMLPKNRRNIESYRKLYSKLDDYLTSRAEQCEKTGDGSNETPQNFVQAYKMEKNKPDAKITQDWLKYIILDVFVAGADTTSNTLAWLLKYMMRYPDVQHRVHQEIDTVLVDEYGQRKQVSLADLPRLPYTEATIMEVQRMCCLAPLTLPHMTTRDVEFKGYYIPQGTHVNFNLWQTTRDETLWKNAHEFDPPRFLSSEGTITRPKHFVSYSMGRRMCLGEQLARHQLFLFFASLMQSFSFHTPHQRPQLEDMEPINSSVALKAKPFLVITHER